MDYNRALSAPAQAILAALRARYVNGTATSGELGSNYGRRMAVPDAGGQSLKYWGLTGEHPHVCYEKPSEGESDSALEMPQGGLSRSSQDFTPAARGPKTSGEEHMSLYAAKCCRQGNRELAQCPVTRQEVEISSWWHAGGREAPAIPQHPPLLHQAARLTLEQQHSIMHPADKTNDKTIVNSSQSVLNLHQSSGDTALTLCQYGDTALKRKHPASHTEFNNKKLGGQTTSPNWDKRDIRSVPNSSVQVKAVPQEAVTILKLQQHKQNHTGKTDTSLKKDEPVKEPGPQRASRDKPPKPSRFLTSDPRIQDVCRLSEEERAHAMHRVTEATLMVLTMVYKDGTTQLGAEQKTCLPFWGILMLLRNEAGVVSSVDGDHLLYLRLEQQPVWVQSPKKHNLDLFLREMVLHLLTGPQRVVCYKAKDLLCTILQHLQGQISWKQVSRCRILDPQIAAWLLDPADSASSFPELLYKHGERLCSRQSSDVVAKLHLLHHLMEKLHSRLQDRGLWDLFSNMEISMIPVLAAMESHRIYVDKEALKKTSDMLGSKLKHLEQEAHRAAGQQFLVSSNKQLRLVLFEKLRLQDGCDKSKLPRTVLRQQQSTSEAALLQLQDLHPLPRIILEYRQVHKMKSTFVDGILSCVKKTYVSPTWNQTCAVSGRLSTKHPNFQALPKQPVQITQDPSAQGVCGEKVTVHPRSMFVPQEGWTFLSADFCQVELRLLAHLSNDPELLRVFHDPSADVFSTLASKWKGVSEDNVSPQDREHAKRIVYSVVYGAGRERLSRILGVTAEQAATFVDSFLQRYREVHSFFMQTIQQCQTQGYVSSLMGRQRVLPHIHSSDWGLRNQAERQAVNFVVQGSAADLCKMAMIHIFSQVASSSTITARLIAQIHDELLFEVEDSQVTEFAALVKDTMESLQNIESVGVHLKVPLKVALSVGKSWGTMSELHVYSAPPSQAP